MQWQRSVDAARVAGSVRGLGVCDVLRIEWVPSQRDDLERQIGARVAALKERRDVLLVANRDVPHDGADVIELEEVRHRLGILERMLADVPAFPVEPFALLGPAGLMAEIVDACLEDAIARVGQSRTEAELATVADWIATALDCQAVDGFSLVAGVDPVHAL